VASHRPVERPWPSSGGRAAFRSAPDSTGLPQTRGFSVELCTLPDQYCRLGARSEPGQYRGLTALAEETGGSGPAAGDSGVSARHFYLSAGVSRAWSEAYLTQISKSSCRAADAA